MKIFTTFAAALLFSVGAVAQCLAGPVGEWRIADGSANITIHPCGGELCGFISWAADGTSMIGKQVLVGMQPMGRIWSGTAVNVRDGQKYSAHLSMASEDKLLKVEGCVTGGTICGGQQWVRIR